MRHTNIKNNIKKKKDIKNLNNAEEDDKKDLKYTFYAYGHENILATHEKTIEFTKDDFLTKKGDCIIGIKANFDLEKLKKFLKFRKARMLIGSDRAKDEIVFGINPRFSSNNELVVRKTDFVSERTFGINANKSASGLNRKIFEILKNPDKKIKAVIESIG